MPKNNVLIEQMKRVKKNIDKITPEIYAGIALALYRKHGWDISGLMIYSWNHNRFGTNVLKTKPIWLKCV